MIDVKTREKCKKAANTYSDIFVQQGSDIYCDKWKADCESGMYDFAEIYIISWLTEAYVKVKLIPADEKERIKQARAELMSLQKQFFEEWIDITEGEVIA